MKKAVLAFAFLVALTTATASESRDYLGVNGTLLAQSSEGAHGGASLLAGGWLTDNVTMEGEAALVEDDWGLAVRFQCNFRAWEEFDLLFGNERFDPFLSFGVRGWFDGGDVGPTLGLGARYYLDDNWAIRGDAEAMLGLNGDVELAGTFSLGVEYTF